MSAEGKGSLRRIDQLLSSCGYCSRREAAYWVWNGRVKVGGKVAASAAEKVQASQVLVDDEPLDAPDGLLILMHKPAGYVCSHDEGEGPRIYDLLPERWNRRNPAPTSIGRLDRDTTGLILITDIMPLVHKLTSPKHHVDKVYEVTVGHALQESLVSRFASGAIHLDGERAPCLPAQLEIVTSTTARLTLQEGKFHQVKRMFMHFGYEVVRLHRVRFGSHLLEDLPEGQLRCLPLP